MGDADNDIQGMAQEFETWMNETTDIVEEGLNNIISLTMELERRTKRIRSEYSTLTSLKRFFFAFNVMVFPVVLALLICYMVREMSEETVNSIQKDVQPVIGFLMFLSGAIGVPCYVYSIFEHVCEDPGNQEKILRFLRLHLWSSSLLNGGGFYRFPPYEFSEERLDELVRVLRHRIPEVIRSGMELRTRFSEVAISTLSPRHELRRLSSEVLRELDPLVSPKAGTNENKDEKIDPKEKEDTIPMQCEMKLRRHDQSSDLAIKIEPKSKLSPESPVSKPGNTIVTVGKSVGLRPVPTVLENLIESSSRRESTANEKTFKAGLCEQ